MLANELVETFLDLTKTLNFNQTADRLNVSQSTISSRIRVLEDQLGAALFTRGRSGAKLTPAGERFQAHAHELFNAWARAMRDVSEAEGFEASLYISAQLSLVNSLFYDLIDAFDQRMPKLFLKLEADYSAQIMRDLSAGEIDIGILFSPSWSPDLYIEPLRGKSISASCFRRPGRRISILNPCLRWCFGWFRPKPIRWRKWARRDIFTPAILRSSSAFTVISYRV